MIQLCPGNVATETEPVTKRICTPIAPMASLILSICDQEFPVASGFVDLFGLVAVGPSWQTEMSPGGEQKQFKVLRSRPLRKFSHRLRSWNRRGKYDESCRGANARHLDCDHKRLQRSSSQHSNLLYSGWCLRIVQFFKFAVLIHCWKEKQMELFKKKLIWILRAPL